MVPQLAARDLLWHGRIPYIGFFDQNFPGYFYIHAGELLLFGSSEIGVRIFDILIQLLFVVFLYRFILRWTEPSTAALIAILYTLYYVSAGSEVYGQRDVYIAILVLLSCSFFVPDRLFDWKSTLVSGLIMGVTVVIRPTSLLFAAIIALFLLLDDSYHITRQRLGSAISFFTYSLLPIAFVIAWYIQIPRGIESFYLATIRFNLDVYARTPTNHSFWWEMARMTFLILFAFVGTFGHNQRFLRRVFTSKERILYFSLVLSALFIALIQAKYFRYHFAPFFILLVPLAAVGIKNIASRIPHLGKVPHSYLILVACFLCTFIRFKPISSLAFGLGLLEHQNPFKFTYQIDHPDSLYGANAEQNLLAFMRLPENSKGAIEVCSCDPVLRFHLKRLCVSRYPTLVYLAIKTPENGYTSYQLRWQRNYVDTLRITKPRFIIIGRKMKFWAISNFDNFLHSLPGFDNLLFTYYQVDTVIGGYEVYRLKNGQSFPVR